MGAKKKKGMLIRYLLYDAAACRPHGKFVSTGLLIGSFAAHFHSPDQNYSLYRVRAFETESESLQYTVPAIHVHVLSTTSSGIPSKQRRCIA